MVKEEFFAVTQMLGFSINNTDFIENYAKTSGGVMYTRNLNYCSLKGI